MKKKGLLFAGSICSVIMFLVISFNTAFCADKPKPILLKCASHTTKNQPPSLAYVAWGKEIEKRTNGRIKCEFYWGQSLVKAVDSLKGVGAGMADVALDVAFYHASYTPFATAVGLGFITSAVDAAAKAQNDLLEEFPVFKDSYEQHNVKVMFFQPFPPNIAAFTFPVQKLDDLRGKKIRALGTLTDVMDKLGATPVGIPFPDIYESLSRKVIDGYTGNIISGVYGVKLHEVAPYHVDFGYGNYGAMGIIMNKDKWNSLPKDIRKTIKEVNDMGVDITSNIYAKEEQRYVEPLIKAGCSFYTLPKDEAEKWKSLVVPDIYIEWVERNKKYGPAQEFLNRYLELVKKYEASSTYINPFPK